MKKPRHLSPDERALWDKVAERTTPMQPELRAVPVFELTQKPKPRAQNEFAPFEIGVKAKHARPHKLKQSIGAQLRSAPIQMDNKSFGKMTRGKLKPEGRLDLHGMTMVEAHPELIAFILGAQSVGKRLVLVITGKGKLRDDGGPMPAVRGVLRHQVPQWMALPPLSSAILQVTPAHLKHGGDGAYYVYLRRRR